ncbi:hypothetical protein [Mucilaginibacter dorajii]|nr:hypothetical protein [Mucilaginibacter dorajii]
MQKGYNIYTTKYMDIIELIIYLQQVVYKWVHLTATKQVPVGG